MKVKRVVLLMLIELAAVDAWGQGDVFPLSTDTIRGWEVAGTRMYDGNGLWGYINGGADIYLEYGFERVYVQEVLHNDHLLKIDAFDMTDSVAAFGIFSVSRFRCLLNDSLPMHHCISPYQILSVLGDHFLIISDQEGTDAATQCGITLLTEISENMQPASFLAPEPFSVNNAEGQLKCIRGKLGLMNGFPSLSDLLESYENYTLYALPVAGDQPDQVLAKIEFADRENQADLIHKLAELQDNAPEKVVYIKATGPEGILFLIVNKEEMTSTCPYRKLFSDQ